MTTLTRLWRYLDSPPGPASSLAVFLAAALALGWLLNALAPAVLP